MINGVKWHVTSYNLADYAFVQAELVGGDHDGDHVLLVVDLPWPGVEVVRTPHYSHTIADEHPIVRVHRRPGPGGAPGRRRGDGMTFTQDWFRFERMMVAARCVGARRTVCSTSRPRSPSSGSSAASRSATTSWWPACSPTCATELFAARAMLYEVARSIDAGTDRKVLHGQASMAKLYCSEMAGRAADRAAQIFGGRGYMRENVAERITRELRVERIWEGASEIQRLIIGGQLDRRGPSALL